MENELRLCFGALAPELSVQLAKFSLGKSSMAHFQKDADAITRCLLRGFIPESAAKRARGRLFKHILAACKRDKGTKGKGK